MRIFSIWRLPILSLATQQWDTVAFQRFLGAHRYFQYYGALSMILYRKKRALRIFWGLYHFWKAHHRVEPMNYFCVQQKSFQKGCWMLVELLANMNHKSRKYLIFYFGYVLCIQYQLKFLHFWHTEDFGWWKIYRRWWLYVPKTSQYFCGWHRLSLFHAKIRQNVSSKIFEKNPFSSTIWGKIAGMPEHLS